MPVQERQKRKHFYRWWRSNSPQENILSEGSSSSRFPSLRGEKPSPLQEQPLSSCHLHEQKQMSSARETEAAGNSKVTVRLGVPWAEQVMHTFSHFMPKMDSHIWF